MGIASAEINLLLSLRETGQFKGLRSVMEIGAQDLRVDAVELDTLLRSLTGKDIQSRDPKGAKDSYSPKIFFQALGFEDYQCIDLDGHNSALVYDLNEDLRAKGFDRQFDLITNYGTSEHCLHQYNVFMNIHNLCSKGGIMIHDVPFQGYLNHGLFNYQPKFFLDLAHANHYDILGTYVVVDMDSKVLAAYSDQLMKYLSSPSFALEDSAMTLMVAYRKTTDAAFRTSYDGMYLGASKLKEAYGISTLPKSFLPIDIKAVAEAIPARSLAKLLAHRIKRKLRTYF